MLRILSALILLILSTALAEARPLRFATWNLGWHLSQAEAGSWISKCDAPFAKDPQTGFWKPAAEGTPGWKLTWGRDAKIEWDLSVLPPCNVFGEAGTVPATVPAYANRSQRIQNVIRDNINPDIIAFQEVSGEQAVREVLPGGGDEYFICSFANFKVQRLAIAWRKTLGPAVACETEASLSLPSLPVADQPRPGLSLLINVDGEPLRIFAVHLKSSCVSPLEGSNGDLAGAADACTILQRQVAPLEAWIETKATDDRFVILGDFNRNLWHERVDRTPVRSDGSDTRDPLPEGVKVSSLIEEIDDAKPFNRQFVLLHESCPQNGFTESVCAAGQVMALTRAETTMLSDRDNLGCSFAFGLDHILIGMGLRVEDNALKVALGDDGKTFRPFPPAFPEPKLAVSDHCPTVATVFTN